MLRPLRSARLLLAAAAVLPVLLAAPAAARPGVPDRPLPTTGCGHAPPVTPGTTGAQTLVSGGLTREYTLHVPSNYQPDRPTSVVLSFHGHKRTSRWQEELSEFSGLNTIAVYPQGVPGTDGESAWTGAPYSADVDDVLFTSDLLTKLQSQLCVDARRVYATGKSNGGGFAGVLACRLPGRIAAFAPVAGAYYPQGGDCSPSRPAPILAFHGTADATIPYAGNPAKGLPAIPDWLGKWAARNGCFAHPVTYSPQPEVTVRKWLGCAERSNLQHYRIDGAGHVWPSTKPNNDSATPTVMDATPVIWRFFQGQRLR
ncbi:alpha/beta hydrolase family esterase [Amycolatopsis albispora]|uniref:Ferulic acid esterase n=1 Tax=Amycolatopsis albispora TaxID=1804986 RepID=A0A344L9C6_9PSEU|nr:ferulic acid esterase [Amycolatopsis albispora]AXB44650.1 ferulic acid esterase [Amycolatopsis albispora]